VESQSKNINRKLIEIIEALIFASEKPISAATIYDVVNASCSDETKNRVKEVLLSESGALEDNADRDEFSDEMSYKEVVKYDTSMSDNDSDPDHEITCNTSMERTTCSEDDIYGAIDVLKNKYNSTDNGAIELVEIGDGYQLRTRPEFGKWIKLLKISRPVRLTKAALETLSILAYKQPVTRAEIDSIRGVDSGYTIRFLMEKKLAKILGKKDIPGRPLLYGTGNEFLTLFGLKNLSSLPTLREFRELTEKHAEKVKELFNEPTIDQLKEKAPALVPYTDKDAENIAEIDKTLAETRKIKSVDRILKHELFQDESNDEMSGVEKETEASTENSVPESETDESTKETERHT